MHSLSDEYLLEHAGIEDTGMLREIFPMFSQTVQL